MSFDRPGRGDAADEPSAADRIREQAETGEGVRPDRETWRDPRAGLSDEDRARFYSRTHVTMTSEELAALEAANIERYGVAYGWNDPDSSLDLYDDEDDDTAAETTDAERPVDQPDAAADRPEADPEPGGREPADQPSSPTEPTTELVREEGNLRYERGTPDDPSDDFELDDEDRSKYDRIVDKAKKAETIQDAEDLGNHVFDTYGRLLDEPRPTGAYVGTPDQPVIREAPRDAVDGGDLTAAAMAMWLVADRGIRSFGRWIGELKQGRGDRDDASD